MSELLKKDSDAESYCFKIFLSHEMGHGAKTRDILTLGNCRVEAQNGRKLATDSLISPGLGQAPDTEHLAHST